MNDKRIYIASAAAMGPSGDLASAERTILTSDPQAAELEELAAALNCQNELRRVSRYTKMALICAKAALDSSADKADEKTGIYFGTGLGEIENTISLFNDSMDPEVLYTSPYSFVSSVNNTSAFYVAKINGLISENMTICQEEFSFEWALKCAAMDMLIDNKNNALVGGADESYFPRSEHMNRLKIKDSQIMGSGCGWLLLQGPREGAIGEFFLLKEFPAVEERENPEDLAALISDLMGPFLKENEKKYLLPGFRIHEDEVHEIIKRFPAMECRNYLDYCACFHTAAAFGIASVFDDRHYDERIYFHLNRNLFGRMFIVGLKVYGDG